jgi:hypothetical protein
MTKPGPRGRALQAIELMRDQPARLWTASELAEALLCTPRAIAPTLGHSVNLGLIGRATTGRHASLWGLPAAIAAVQLGPQPEPDKEPAVFPEPRTWSVMKGPALTFTLVPSLRPGAMDAFALPSNVGGDRIERRIPIVLGSSVPQVARK